MRGARSSGVFIGLVLGFVACSRSGSGGAAVASSAPPPGDAAAAVIRRETVDAGADGGALVDSGRVAPEAPKNGVYLGRKIAAPMSHLGASWLDRPNRDDVQQPEHVLDVLGVHEGQVVCDFGAGSGYFTLHLARRVAPGGSVLAVDLQPEMLALLAKKLDAEKIHHVTPILARASEPSLPRASVDLVLMVDVYHELERPDLTMAQLRDALRPGGRVAWVEYRAEDPTLPIKAEHKTSLAQLRREAAAVGYRVERVDESLPQQRIVVLAP